MCQAPNGLGLPQIPRSLRGEVPCSLWGALEVHQDRRPGQDSFLLSRRAGRLSSPGLPACLLAPEAWRRWVLLHFQGTRNEVEGVLVLLEGFPCLLVLALFQGTLPPLKYTRAGRWAGSEWLGCLIA